MSEIVAVLVVPADGDPGGLLAAGRCGSTAPTGPAYQPGRPGGEPEWALPLWWDGALVPEGWDRARRVLGRYTRHDWRHALHPTLLDVEVAALKLHARGDASRVVRLARVDGRLVEVAP